MANNPYVNKVVFGSATLVDLTGTTATADKIMQGYGAFGADGAWMDGTATGGGTGGNVWQDANGYVHLDDEGSSAITVEPLSVTQNGIYTAPTGKAYSPVTVNVSGGGSGGSSWELLDSKEFTVSTTTTSNTSVGTISLDLSKYDDPETMVWVHVRDKAGKRSGYVYGSDTIFFSYALANGSTNSLSIRPVMLFYVNSSGNYAGVASAYGVYAYRLYYTSSSHYVDIYSRYSASYGAIDGTFKCDVYTLKPPSGMKLFEIEE